MWQGGSMRHAGASQWQGAERMVHICGKQRSGVITTGVQGLFLKERRARKVENKGHRTIMKTLVGKGGGGQGSFMRVTVESWGTRTPPTTKTFTGHLPPPHTVTVPTPTKQAARSLLPPSCQCAVYQRAEYAAASPGLSGGLSAASQCAHPPSLNIPGTQPYSKLA